MTTHTEKKVARTLGVSRKDLRRQRKELAEETDFRRDGRDIVYTDEGVQKLLKIFQLSKENLSSAEASPPSPGSSGDSSDAPGEDSSAFQESPEVGLTAAATTRNPRILLATTGDGKRVRVKVKDCNKFSPGMELKARLLEGDLYELTGRGPRYKGKW